MMTIMGRRADPALAAEEQRLRAAGDQRAVEVFTPVPPQRPDPPARFATVRPAIPFEDWAAGRE